MKSCKLPFSLRSSRLSTKVLLKLSMGVQSRDVCTIMTPGVSVAVSALISNGDRSHSGRSSVNSKFSQHDIFFFFKEKRFIYPLRGIWVTLPGDGYSRRKSKATHSYQYVQYFSVAKQMVWLPMSDIVMMYTQTVMHVTAHGDCMSFRRESERMLRNVMSLCKMCRSSGNKLAVDLQTNDERPK